MWSALFYLFIHSFIYLFIHLFIYLFIAFATKSTCFEWFIIPSFFPTVFFRRGARLLGIYCPCAG